MQDFNRALQREASGNAVLRYGTQIISLSTRDMVRVGQLMLQHGRWNGKEVVPADWIKTITSLVTPIEQLNPPTRRTYANGYLWGFGYMWWAWDDHHNNTVGPFQGAYSASWNAGEYLTVLPTVNWVIAHKTPFVEGQPRPDVSYQQ